MEKALDCSSEALRLHLSRRKRSLREGYHKSSPSKNRIYKGPTTTRQKYIQVSNFDARNNINLEKISNKDVAYNCVYNWFNSASFITLYSETEIIFNSSLCKLWDFELLIRITLLKFVVKVRMLWSVYVQSCLKM